MANEIVYQLTIEDVQEVANQEIGRDLTKDEIAKITDAIAERIPWYDAISDSIHQCEDIEEEESEDIKE